MSAVKHPDARPCHHLVTREREEVTSNVLNIYRTVSHDLRAVKDDERPRVVGHFRDSFDGRYGSEDIRAACKGYDLWPQFQDAP